MYNSNVASRALPRPAKFRAGLGCPRPAQACRAPRPLLGAGHRVPRQALPLRAEAAASGRQDRAAGSRARRSRYTGARADGPETAAPPSRRDAGPQLPSGHPAGRRPLPPCPTWYSSSSEASLRMGW